MLEKSNKGLPLNSQAAHRDGPTIVWSLYYDCSQTPLVYVVFDTASSLHRVTWPDIGLSPPANLSRCKAAARLWAEQWVLTEHPKLSVAQRLKLLDNFFWSASPVRQNDLADPESHEDRRRISEPPNGSSPGKQLPKRTKPRASPSPPATRAYPGGTTKGNKS